MQRISGAMLAAAALLAAVPAAALAQGNGGDIPDTQVFVTYHSPRGVSLKVPEGWARSTTPSGASFADHYDVVAIAVTPAAAAPTPAAASDPAALGTAAKVTKSSAVSEPGGPAVLVAYTSDSAPNPVTGKTIRLENERFLFWSGGKLATLTLSAPKGADNLDQWRLMSRSFQWG